MYENINNNLNQTDFILNYHQHKKIMNFIYLLYIFLILFNFKFFLLLSEKKNNQMLTCENYSHSYVCMF